MDALLYVFQYLDSLRDMAALALSRKDLSSGLTNPAAGVKSIVVQRHMLRNAGCCACFVTWWMKVCSFPELHVRVWEAMQGVLDTNAARHPAYETDDLWEVEHTTHLHDALCAL